jgi:hypothetical protein
MTASALRKHPGNILYALAKRARKTSGGALVALESAGLASALAIWIWAPAHWQLALPGLALAAFGLWGIIDKTVAARGRRPDPLVLVILQALRFVVAACGVAAAVSAGYLIVGYLMGIFVL